MIKRVLLAVIALSALSGAVATVVVAAAFALYALLREPLGPAGAAGVVALAFALLAGLVALIVGLQAGGRRRTPPPQPSPVERMTQFAKERPIVAGGAALAAGLIALRNPQVVVSLVSAFLGAKAADKPGRNRR